jgi:hypothetical protein
MTFSNYTLLGAIVMTVYGSCDYLLHPPILFVSVVAQNPDVSEEFLTLLGQAADHHGIHAGLRFMEADRHMVVSHQDSTSRIFWIRPIRPGVPNTF